MANRYSYNVQNGRPLGMDHSNFHNCNKCQCRTCQNVKCPALCKSAYGCLAPVVKCQDVSDGEEVAHGIS